MYIKKSKLLESIGTAPVKKQLSLSHLFEDQSKMTQEQKEKDIKKRLSAQTIGIEIELYSKMGIQELEAYIHYHREKYQSLKGIIDAKYDGSLVEYGDDIDYGGSDEATEALANSNPVEYATDIEGIDLEDVVKIYIGDNADKEIIENKIFEIRTELGQAGRLLNEMTLTGEADKYKNNAVRYIRECMKDELLFVPFVETYYELTDLKNAIDQLEMINDSRVTAIKDNLQSTLADSKIEKNISESKAIADFYLEASGAKLADTYLREAAKSEYFLTIKGYLGINSKGEDGDYMEDDDPVGIKGKYGVELVTNKPLNLRSIQPIVKELVEVCNDKKVSATFVDEPSMSLHTGLHLHYGLTPGIKYNLLDMVRLWRNTYDSMDEVTKYAGRGENDYAKSMSYIIDEFYDTMSEMLNEYYNSGKISTKPFNYFTEDKHMGVNFINLKNVPGKKNTVEFRWASSSICKTEKSFMDYINFTSGLLADSFTGSTTMEFDRLFTLAETSSVDARYYYAREGNKVAVVSTTYPGESAAERLLVLSDTEFDVTGEPGSMQLIDKNKFNKLKERADNKNIFVYEDFKDETSSKAPAINVLYDGKLIGKIITKDIHISGESAKLHSDNKYVLQQLKAAKEEYGSDSEEYKELLSKFKDVIGKKK